MLMNVVEMRIERIGLLWQLTVYIICIYFVLEDTIFSEYSTVGNHLESDCPRNVIIPL